MEKPLVSIIMPAYNCEKTIGRAVESVKMQDYSRWQLIICDDCSADNTLKMLEEISQGDARVMLLKNSVNQGPAAARNRAISEAEGEFIAFLDSDDEWLEGKLSSQIDFMSNEKIDFCYTGYCLMNSEGLQVGKRFVPEGISYDSLLAENYIILSTVIIKTSAAKKIKFNGEYVHEDFVFWLELLKNGLKGSGMPVILAKYSMGGRSKNKIMAAKNRWTVYRKSEGLSLLTSAKYFAAYMQAGVKKYKSEKY